MPVRIDIVRRNGNVVFEPSPAFVAKNDSAFWHNADKKTHHISLCPKPVLPGQNTAAVLITGDRSYTCIIAGHPGEGGQISTSVVG